METGASSRAQKLPSEDQEDGMIEGEDAPVLIKIPKSKSKGARKLKELKFAVTEFYLSLILIQNFQVKVC